jgi:hypothetical protein
VKFGYGIYLTSRYETAAHYSWPRKATSVEHNYVYTLEIPEPTAENTLNLDPAVALSASLIQLVEDKLGETLPEEAIAEPKYLRKYVGNLLIGKSGTITQLTDKASLEAEKIAAKFFSEIGLEYFVWPYNWKKPDDLTNRVVLNIDKIRIVRIDKVELDPKNFQFIEGTDKAIPLDNF